MKLWLTRQLARQLLNLRQKVEEVAAVAEPVVGSANQAPVVHEGGKVRATPKARKVARELGIDLAQVPGTGAKRSCSC